MATDDVLEAWAAAGTDELMLPSGTEVRVMLPAPGALARHEITPSVLRGVISRLTGQLEQGGLSDEDWTRWEAAIRILIGDSVVAIKPPGREAFAPYRILPEHFTERKVPPVDVDALTALVMYLESPAQVDARSRAARGLITAAAAAQIFIDAESESLPAWERFVGSSEGYLCAVSAQTWSQRPSALLGIRNPSIAYFVDEALALRLLFDRSRRSARNRRPGVQYEDLPAVPFDPAIADDVHAAHLEHLRAEGRLKTH